MNSFKRNFILVFLLLTCIYGLYTSYTRGSANAWYYKANFALEEWSKEGTIRDQQQYSETLEAIKKAQSLDPGHPHYTHMLGKIMHWGVEFEYEEDEKLTEIKNWYFKATKLRPLWPEPWVDLARLNNYLNGYNPETQYYIQQAIKTGPFYDLVTIGVVYVLLKHWDDLSEDDKTLLFQQFSVATKQPEVFRIVMNTAKRKGREQPLCSQLNLEPEYLQLKQSYTYRQTCKKTE